MPRLIADVYAGTNTPRIAAALAPFLNRHRLNLRVMLEANAASLARGSRNPRSRDNII
jgi:hypothetical protein